MKRFYFYEAAEDVIAAIKKSKVCHAQSTQQPNTAIWVEPWVPQTVVEFDKTDMGGLTLDVVLTMMQEEFHGGKA